MRKQALGRGAWVCIVLATAAAAACGGSDGVGLFPSGDDGGDGDAAPLGDASRDGDGTIDGGVDADQDAARDAKVDATQDAAVDAGDASADAGSDAALDAPADAALDAPADAALDAPADAALDAPADAALDAPADAALDAPADAALDAPADAADGATCDPVVGNPPVYYVDPNAGNDATATGSGTRAGNADATCAFKTITAALTTIGTAPPIGTMVVVRGVSTVSAGETWPIAVPTGLTVLGTGGVTVAVPAGQVGFRLLGAQSGLSTLTIDGSSHSALNGIVATNGSALSTTIDNVTVQAFARDGIAVVDNATLSIHQGVVASDNGTNGTTARYAGLHVSGNGRAFVDVPSGQTQTSFSRNVGYGVLVDGIGFVRMTGVPGLSGGTIAVVANASAGVRINQPSQVLVSENILDGVVVFGTTGGPGVWLFGGSSAKLRNSVVLGNSTDGVRVQTNIVGNLHDNSLRDIDLGIGGDFGKNTFQSSRGGLQNQGSGVCLLLDQTAMQTLDAQGNTFSQRDCSQNNPGLITRGVQCSGATDIGLAPGVLYDINVTNCTHP